MSSQVVLRLLQMLCAMNALLKLFACTLLLSFLGSLPLGTLNVSITNLAFHKGAGAAFAFGLGAVLIELLLVRLAVEAVGRLERFRYWFKWFECIALLVLLLFAGITLIAAIQMKGFRTAVPLPDANPFWLGLLLSILNPLHLPFWLGWTTALKAKGILRTTKTDYNLFVSGIGLGTALAFIMYALAGTYLIGLLDKKQYVVNWIAGMTLLATAVFQMCKMYSDKLQKCH